MKQWLLPTFGAFVLWGLWSFIPKITTKYISPKSAIVFEVLRYNPKLWTEKKEGVSYKCCLT